MKNKQKKDKKNVLAVNCAADPFGGVGARKESDPRFWRWGDDNMFPQALALMSRRR